MKPLQIVLFVIQSIAIKTIHSNMDLMKDYLKFNDISIALFLTCDNTTEKIKRMIEMKNDDIWLSFFDISSENEIRSLNYKNLFVRLSSPLSMVIDLDCKKSIKVLEEISIRKMFHYERSYLIFCKSWNQSYEILRHQFINMDAEIYLALPTSETYIENVKVPMQL